MRGILKTEAIVLKKTNLPNKDVIITFFSPLYGKLRVYAKGIKNITSRRQPHNQTGNLLNAIIRRKRDVYYLQETQLISAFSQIKKNSKKLSYLYCILFILDRLLPELNEELEVFGVTKQFLVELARNPVFSQIELERHLNNIMKYFGYIKKDKSFLELTAFIEEIISEKIPFFVI